jgi:hypothetical protein
MSIKSTVVWNTLQCSPVEVLWNFGATYCLHIWLLFNAEDGDNTFLQNISEVRTDYVASHAEEATHHIHSCCEDLKACAMYCSL